MRTTTFSITAALFISLLSTNAFAKPPIPLTDCETITQPGNYILENDLVASPRENCLVISSSHVNVDLNGQTITCLVSGEFPCSAIEDSLAGIGIDIEADHVSVSNGRVENYGTGIVGTAEHISATNLSLATFTGIVLSDVSHGAFANIGYEGVDLEGLPVTPGPVLSVSGGGFNIFTSINSTTNTFEGIIIANSSFNFIGGADVSCSAEGVSGPGILITQDSSRNFVTNSDILVLFGNGIEVDLGSDHNVILDNKVETETTEPGFFALFDRNPDCDSNFWIDNTFSNIFMPGEISANPASCIH
jgi:hypothetical protein